MAASLDGHRPWLWALLVAAPLAIIELPAAASGAPLGGLLFAAIGAAGSWLARRAMRTER